MSSTQIDCVVVLSRPTPSNQACAALDKCLVGIGATYQEDTNVIFNDHGSDERDPEEASTADAAWARILAWPGLGGTSHEVLGHRVSIFLFGGRPFTVEYLTLSCSSRDYDEAVAFCQAFKALGVELHEILEAKRTFAGVELLSPGSWVAEEVERVRRGVFEQRYDVDLRR